MHFQVSRLAAAMSLAFAVAAPNAFADTINPETVVVTANRTPQRAEEVIADVTVISNEEITRSGAGSIADVLRRQRGIEIARNGGPGTNTSVFLRGSNANQVIVLIDGVRVGSSTTGTASWNAIPLSSIDHIEVVYGPSVPCTAPTRSAAWCRSSPGRAKACRCSAPAAAAAPTAATSMMPASPARPAANIPSAMR
jgi:vitamin B12 transporter